ncbi:MAG: XRE family transcriptional regulator [Acidimicrobiaceae bacterium]|nr:XRE family transcriptional regulator [Acidimicrobiaceae bacterium]
MNPLAGWRKAVGLTQAEVARRWGRSQPQVARIEKVDFGSLTMRTLQAYVEALGGSLLISFSCDDENFAVLED